MNLDYRHYVTHSPHAKISLLHRCGRVYTPACLSDSSQHAWALAGFSDRYDEVRCGYMEGGKGVRKCGEGGREKVEKGMGKGRSGKEDGEREKGKG